MMVTYTHTIYILYSYIVRKEKSTPLLTLPVVRQNETGAAQAQLYTVAKIYGRTDPSTVAMVTHCDCLIAANICFIVSDGLF